MGYHIQGAVRKEKVNQVAYIQQNYFLKFRKNKDSLRQTKK